MALNEAALCPVPHFFPFLSCQCYLTSSPVSRSFFFFLDFLYSVPSTVIYRTAFHFLQLASLLSALQCTEESALFFFFLFPLYAP